MFCLSGSNFFFSLIFPLTCLIYIHLIVSSTMQLLESQVARDFLISENQQLKASLDRAVATTSELAESLRDKEAALHALRAKQSRDLKNEGEVENSYEGT